MSALTTTSPHPLRPQNFGELVEFAKMAARSTLVPRDYLGKPENILLAIQMGSEIGLAPMQSLQNISVINGRPSVWGDAMLGLCRQSPACKDVVEYFEGDGKELTAVCVAKRAGAEPIERRFSMDDAERAGLASKAGTWQQYPRRMLQMRARGFALRDAFPDVLRGLISTEEAEDIPEEKFAGKTVESTAAEVPMKAVAATTPRPERKVDPTVYEAAPAAPQRKSWAQWADALEVAGRDASNDELGRMIARAEVAEIYRLAQEGDQTPAKKRIVEAYRSIEERYLADPPEPDLSDEALGEVALGEIEIKGMEKVAAG